MTRIPLSQSLIPSLRDFIVELWPIDGARSEMHIGDVYFTLYFVTDGELEHSAVLWYDLAGKLQAASFLTGSTFDMVVRPESAASPIAADMIACVISESKRRNPNARMIRVQRRPQRRERIVFLEGLGFRRSASGVLALERALSELPHAASLDPGLTCRALRARDVPSRMRAFMNAFPGEPKVTADYERLMRCDGYEPFLDLVAVDRSGEVAAFCSTWFDRVNRVGLFEPVGTCTRYRRMGLARALMSEGLRRLKQLGAISAVVRVRNENAAAIACYKKLGFSIVCDAFGFEKSL
ncbi:MAG: GNAT family N-acetyltransferase [Candidatus Cybelea sp.]